MIYHILTSAEWELAARQPYYTPSAFGTDGFIHCCNANQLEYVGERYFRGRKDLIILCIEADRVTALVKYEDLNGEGMSFPHIYGILNLDAVQKIIPMSLSADGTFTIPPAIDS
jgi:uncharacterized protein (DUF952 family)